MGHKNLILKFHTIPCLLFTSDFVCLFGVKIIGLSSLESLLFFEFLLSLLLLQAQTPPASPPLSLHNCFFTSMPRRRESLESVKERLVREQKLRTERRVQALLHPRDRREEEEQYDDSEKENRIRARRAQASRKQATQTNSSSWSFCCGVLVGVFGVVSLLWVLVLVSGNGRQRLEE